MTLTGTAAGAGISTVTFYEHFETVEDVYLAALDEILGRLAPQLLTAFEAQPDWPSGVRAAIAFQ